jgi:hypothetical protein
LKIAGAASAIKESSEMSRMKERRSICLRPGLFSEPLGIFADSGMTASSRF